MLQSTYINSFVDHSTTSGTLQSQITTNTNNISTNTSDISDNTALIATTSGSLQTQIDAIPEGVDTSGTPVANDYARFIDVDTIEGRSYSEVRSDLNVDNGADVTGDNPPQAHKDSHDPNDGSDALDTAAAAEISVVVAAGTGTSHSFARADHIHAINHSIANNHIVTIDGTTNTNEYARFTANGIVGRTNSEVKSDLGITMSKSISVEYPTDSESITMFFTPIAITVSEMRAVVSGTLPSVTWTIKHHANNKSTSGNEVVTGGTTTTSTTTGSDVTSFDDATIAADSFVWFETTAQTGTVDEVHTTLVYTED